MHRITYQTTIKNEYNIINKMELTDLFPFLP